METPVLHTPITATTQWIADPRVRTILASLAANPPRTEHIPTHARWSAASRVAVGYRVECLRRLWNMLAAPVMREAEKTGDYEPWRSFCFDQPDVDDVVEAAVRGDLEMVR